MKRVAYFKGVQLWEHFQELEGPAERGELGQNLGIHQTWAVQFGDSPNFSRPELRVSCVVGPVEPYDDLPERATLDLVIAQVEAALVAGGATAGDLAIAYDAYRRAQVDNAGPYAAGTAVAVGHDGEQGGWIPAVGKYVLVRNPSTGAGWVSEIKGVASGQLNLDLEAQIDEDWEIVSVQIWYADVWYVRQAVGERDPEQDAFRRGVDYSFAGASNPITAAAHAVPRGNA